MRAGAAAIASRYSYLSPELALAIAAVGCFLATTWALLVALLSSVCWVWLERYPELY